MKNGFLSLFFLITTFSWAQIPATRFFVEFVDKGSSSFSLQRPSEFLSQRSIERRLKFNIPLDSSDLPVTAAYVASVQRLGGLIHCTSKWFNGVVVEPRDSQSWENIKLLPCVKSTQPVFKLKRTDDPWVEPAATEGVASFPDSVYGIGLTQVKQLNLQSLHQEGFTGKGVWIAVLDAGFINVPSIAAFQHLFTEGRIFGNRDFVDRDNDPFNGDIHGTLVLSCMAAKLPGVMIGTAPDAKYTLLRTEDVGSERRIEEFNWIAGAEYADSLGIDVFNTSLGYTWYDPIDSMQQITQVQLDGNTTYITRGADLAAKKGILVVNSAGNEGGSAWGNISAPSDGDSVFCIGAVDSSGFRAGFSGRGLSSQRIKPNVMALGARTPLLNHNGNPSTGSGTSFSGPVIAGAMACLVQAFPQKSNWELMKAVEKSSSQFQNPDTLMGYGIPDFGKVFQALNQWNKYFPKDQDFCLVFPNPVGTNSRIVFKEAYASVTLRLWDSRGRLIKQWNIANQMSEDLSWIAQLQQGAYFLDVETELLQTRIRLVH